MQENWQRLKIPPAFKPDEWICHHSGNRSSTRMSQYSRYGSSNRYFTTPVSTKRSKEIENFGSKSADYRQSKIKRLTSGLSRQSYKSLWSSISHRTMTPIHIPKMSKPSLKRWLDARDAYLGYDFPYIQDHFIRQYRQRKTKSAKSKSQMIDYESAISILSMEIDGNTIADLPPTSSGQQNRFNRKDTSVKRLSQSDTNIRRNLGFFDRLKEFIQRPVRSISRLSLHRSPRFRQPKHVRIIHDNFDDKCVGTEKIERRLYRTDIQRQDQCLQTNIPRPKIHLHHEFDTSMVVGEKKQRIRSARHDVECADKAIETDVNFKSVNVVSEKREEQKLRDVNHKTTTHHSEQSQSASMSIDKKTKQQKKRQTQFVSSSNAGNRVVPRNHNEQMGSRLTILSSADSNLSTNEQLQR